MTYPADGRETVGPTTPRFAEGSFFFSGVSIRVPCERTTQRLSSSSVVLRCHVLIHAHRHRDVRVSEALADDVHWH